MDILVHKHPCVQFVIIIKSQSVEPNNMSEVQCDLECERRYKSSRLFFELQQVNESYCCWYMSIQDYKNEER